MAFSTRTEGSCSPRSIWLRYGFETLREVGQVAQRHLRLLALRADELAERLELLAHAFVDGHVRRR